MMKVPCSVIHGKSPMKTVWCLTSSVSLITRSTSTFSGFEKVRSRVRHSSSLNFGSSK